MGRFSSRPLSLALLVALGALVPAGPAAAECTPVGTLACGDDRTDDTTGGSTAFGAYECLIGALAGPEQVWLVQPDVATTVTITLLPADADLGLVVLDAACDPSVPGACEGASDFLGAGGLESVTFAADGVAAYAVVVDGVTAGAYRLQVTCGDGVPETTCADAVDDDLDGRTDCDDLDCALFAPCATRELGCADGIDEDTDGDTDCDDEDCTDSPFCFGVELVCDDDLDDDEDGDTDCDDLDCEGTTACALPTCVPVASLACTSVLSGEVLATGGTDTYACSDLPYTSGEVAYELFVPETVLATIHVEPAVELDAAIVVLEDTCAPELCVATRDFLAAGGGETLSFRATAGRAYYVLVDGYEGGAGGFELSVDCAAVLPETNCANGMDDDGDGAPDCEDEDCAATPDCTVCEDDALEENDTQTAAVPVQAGDARSDLVLAADDEDWFAITLCAGAVLRVTAATAAGDVDLTLLRADGEVVTAATAEGPEEELVHTSTTGGAFFVVATTVDGDCLPYTLAFAVDESGCGGATELDCTDGADDDADGTTDCDDLDCEGAAPCLPIAEPVADAGATDAGGGEDASGGTDALLPGPDVADAEAPGSDVTGADLPTPPPDVAAGEDTGAPDKDSFTRPDRGGEAPDTFVADVVTPEPDAVAAADTAEDAGDGTHGSGGGSSGCQAGGGGTGGVALLLFALAVLPLARRRGSKEGQA